MLSSLCSTSISCLCSWRFNSNQLCRLLGLFVLANEGWLLCLLFINMELAEDIRLWCPKLNSVCHIVWKSWIPISTYRRLHLVIWISRIRFCLKPILIQCKLPVIWTLFWEQIKVKLCSKYKHYHLREYIVCKMLAILSMQRIELQNIFHALYIPSSLTNIKCFWVK